MQVTVANVDKGSLRRSRLLYLDLQLYHIHEEQAPDVSLNVKIICRDSYKNQNKRKTNYYATRPNSIILQSTPSKVFLGNILAGTSMSHIAVPRSKLYPRQQLLPWEHYSYSQEACTLFELQPDRLLQHQALTGHLSG